MADNPEPIHLLRRLRRRPDQHTLIIKVLNCRLRMLELEQFLLSLLELAHRIKGQFRAKNIHLVDPFLHFWQMQVLSLVVDGPFFVNWFLFFCFVVVLDAVHWGMRLSVF